MANRRMFSKDVIGTRRFLEMPPSSRALYYQLGVEADDDGFIDPYTTMLATKATEDDLKLLVAKRFVINFETGVIVITHWKQSNFIRKDTYTETQYKEEKSMITEGVNGVYMISHSVVDDPSTQYRLGQGRIGKDSTEEISESTDVDDKLGANINLIIGMFKPVNPMFANLFANKTQRLSVERLIKVHGLEHVKRIMESLPNVVGEPYAPRITTPKQLEDKLGELIIFMKQKVSQVESKGVFDATA